jgi:hypothetical protein
MRLRRPELGTALIRRFTIRRSHDLSLKPQTERRTAGAASDRDVERSRRCLLRHAELPAPTHSQPAALASSKCARKTHTALEQVKPENETAACRLRALTDVTPRCRSDIRRAEGGVLNGTR